MAVRRLSGRSLVAFCLLFTLLVGTQGPLLSAISTSRDDSAAVVRAVGRLIARLRVASAPVSDDDTADDDGIDVAAVPSSVASDVRPQDLGSPLPAAPRERAHGGCLTRLDAERGPPRA